MAFLDNTLNKVIDEIARTFPPGWRITEKKESRPQGKSRADAILKVRSPDGKVGSIFVELKNRLEPKDVDYWSAILKPPKNQLVVFVAPFLSERTRERLTEKGFGYADLTGNIRLSLAKPTLFIQTSGATENPAPGVRDRKSLKGAKAGRLIRTLCDFRPPMGVRELANRAGIDAGYTSRIVEFLDREALVTREERGRITTVDWPALIRRWSQEYSPFQRAPVTWYLAPRGIEDSLKQLKASSIRYAVSGSWAAAQFAPVSPSRLLLCYTENISALAGGLNIRPTEANAGANIALTVPFDSVVFDRTLVKKEVTVAALSQIAVDLLTSPGRGPNEAETLIDWMRDNEDVWRT
jgi:hypothetical protein